MSNKSNAIESVCQQFVEKLARSCELSENK